MALRSVTVFGGSGFVGRHLVVRLAKAGWQVRVAQRHPAQAQFLKPLGEVGQITPVYARLQDRASVQAALEGADAVVNLVGILYEKGAQTFAAVHTQGAQTIAEAAAAASVKRLVQISAIGANPSAAANYARSNGAGEEAVRKAFPAASILRPSIIFGPEDDFFNRFAGMACLSPVLPLIGGGHTKFQPVYVGDVAAAIVKCLVDPACQGETYELGGPKVYSFAELMALILAEIHRKRFLVPVPFIIAEIEARFAELLPVPPLTLDQVKMLRQDNVVAESALGLADLGIEATAAEIVLPTYLERFRPGGRFGKDAA